MRLLLLGGSWFLGRRIAGELVRHGWNVTVFNRGRSTVPLPAGVRHLRGDRDRDDDLRSLARSGPWDVVIDISGKIPSTVRRSVRALAAATRRYVSVSTVQVYRDWPHAAVAEDSLLRAGDPGYTPETLPWDPADYGQMKVGCEFACREIFGEDRLLVLRLEAMIGPGEYMQPLRWWLERIRRGGRVLLPAPDATIQAIDARDVASFLVGQVQRGGHGIFNVAAPAEGRAFGAMPHACADVASARAAAPPEPVWADEGWLAGQGVRQWTEIPLWRHAAAGGKVCVDRALAAGLRCRPLAETIADTWRWMGSGAGPADHKPSAEYGMNPDREAAMIARWLAEAAGPRGGTVGGGSRERG